MRREALPECVSGWTVGVLQRILRGDQPVQLKASELTEQRPDWTEAARPGEKAQRYRDLSHMAMESVERLSFRTILVIRNSELWTKTSEPLFDINGWLSLLSWKPPF